MSDAQQPTADVSPAIGTANRKKPLAALAIAVCVAAAGLFYLLSPRSSESTDNAYIKADTTTVAPRVGGLVAEVLVKDNQAVKAGDPLIRLDTQQYDQRVAEAEAALADAEAGVATASAALHGLDADQALAQAKITSAGTAIGSADAEYDRAAHDQQRYDSLVHSGFATRRDAERVRTEATRANAERERVRAERDVTVRSASVIGARRPVLLAELNRARANEASARAKLDLARQDQGFTLIRAPVDGVVGDRQAQVGDFVQPGTRLLTLVPTNNLYVVANFKETQTRRMLAGQPVRIEVDALDGEEITGRIESFAPASGSEFALLPFEPGSGNFTKLVQRVPIRIRLDPQQKQLALLRPGLSVTAVVSLRGS